MQETVKKFFDAPWKAEEYKHGKGAFVVRNNGGYLVAENMSGQDSARLACLPEIYDALLEAAAGECWSCAGENTETILDHPCPKGHDEDCYVAKWRELLRKVRDGE